MKFNQVCLLPVLAAIARAAEDTEDDTTITSTIQIIATLIEPSVTLGEASTTLAAESIEPTLESAAPSSAALSASESSSAAAAESSAPSSIELLEAATSEAVAIASHSEIIEQPAASTSAPEVPSVEFANAAQVINPSWALAFGLIALL